MNPMKILKAKAFSLIFLFSLSFSVFGNMASPFRDGTKMGSVLSSKDIRILKENIHIKTDRYFRHAKYTVTYTIQTDTSGLQTPLLFLAMEYRNHFSVSVDNQPVKLLDFSEQLTKDNLDKLLSPFSDYFNSSFHFASDSDYQLFSYDSLHKRIRSSDQFKYFELNLSKGIHQITVEYNARVWKDLSDWITKYSFRYSLSPAKYWKSFGSLEIVLDRSDFSGSIYTNLGKPAQGNLENKAVWKFSKLPGEYILIHYNPPMNQWTKFLLWLSPLGITLLFVTLTVILHFIAIRKLKKHQKTVLWIMLPGGIILPFFLLFYYPLSYELIDYSIGDDASSYHGYVSLVIFLYPIAATIYGAILWQEYKSLFPKDKNLLHK